MKLETLGHAGMLLSDANGSPLLLTDPWLIGSTYWRSWWLQNYPTAEKLAILSEVKYAYITHEHPDHFHPPSLRRLGKKPQYLCPDLPENRIDAYLTENDFSVEPLIRMKWRALTENVRVLSIPLWNDDSVLLVDTPTAFIINLNDSKPSFGNLKRIRAFANEHIDRTKKCIVLSSYSPASIVNSFMRDSERVTMKDKSAYVKRTSEVCDILGADYFMPFASQVIFLRSDSQWANSFKVSMEDMRRDWSAKTELLNPYSQIDLETMTVTHTAPEDYNEDWRTQLEKVTAQEQLDETIEIGDEDIARLEKKMRVIRLMAMVLFPRGVGFRIRDLELTFRPWTGRVTRGKATGNFVLNVPAAAIKDALAYDHFGDLGITMFTIVNLNRSTRPLLVYLFFIVLTLHDYKHITSVGGFFKWAKSVFNTRAWNIPRLPVSS